MNYIKRVIVSPCDNKNHKERFSLFLYTKQTDAPVNLDYLDSFVARIDLPPFKKKKGQWESKVSVKTNCLLPLPIPDSELWGVLVCGDENVSSEFTIDWETILDAS